MKHIGKVFHYSINLVLWYVGWLIALHSIMGIIPHLISIDYKTWSYVEAITAFLVSVWLFEKEVLDEFWRY